MAPTNGNNANANERGDYVMIPGEWRGGGWGDRIFSRRSGQWSRALQSQLSSWEHGQCGGDQVEAPGYNKCQEFSLQNMRSQALLLPRWCSRRGGEVWGWQWEWGERLYFLSLVLSHPSLSGSSSMSKRILSTWTEALRSTIVRSYVEINIFLQSVSRDL